MTTSPSQMKTLHIKDWSEYPWKGGGLQSFLASITGKAPPENKEKEQKLKLFLVDLYNNFLKDVIIRFSEESVLEKVSQFLRERNVPFEVYDYPTPSNSDERRYGEQRGGIVLNNLQLFLPVFHAHSVAALSLNDDDHFEYMERVVHTMFNPRSYTRDEEGKHLAKLAIFKCGMGGVQEAMDNYPN